MSVASSPPQFFLFAVDECILGMHNCSSLAFCNDTIGAFNCTCQSGYVGSGQSCQDRKMVPLNEIICLSVNIIHFLNSVVRN